MVLQIGKLIKKYCIVTVLPTFVVYSIYSDYARTQKYKQRKAIERKQIEINQQENVPYYS